MTVTDISHHIVDNPPRVITYGTRGQVIAECSWPTVDAARAFAQRTADFVGGAVVSEIDPVLWGVYDAYLEEFTEAFDSQRQAEERATELNDDNFNSYDRVVGAEERYTVDQLPQPYPEWAIPAVQS